MPGTVKREAQAEALQRLAALIEEALQLADALGEGMIAMLLNDAMIEATGRGIVPPGQP